MEKKKLDIEKMSQESGVSIGRLQACLVIIPQIQNASTVLEAKKAFWNATALETKVLAMEKWIELTSTIPEIKEAFVSAFVLGDKEKVSDIAYEKWINFSLKAIGLAATIEEFDEALKNSPTDCTDIRITIAIFKKKVELSTTAVEIKNIFDKNIFDSIDSNEFPGSAAREMEIKEKKAIVLRRWKEFSLKAIGSITTIERAKEVDDDISLFYCFDELSLLYDNIRNKKLVWKKWKKLLRKKVKKITTTAEAKSLFPYSVNFPKIQSGILKKWFDLITTSSEAKEAYEVTQMDSSLEKWKEISLWEVRVTSTKNGLLEALKNSPPNSEAETAAIGILALYYK